MKYKIIKWIDVKPGDIYITPGCFGYGVLPYVVTKIKKGKKGSFQSELTDHKTCYEGGGRLNKPLETIILRESQGKLDMFVGDGFVKYIKIIEKYSKNKKVSPGRRLK